MSMDWVPASGYGSTQAIGSAQQADFPLLDRARFAVNSEVVGVVEESDELFVHRIVGQYACWWQDIPGTYPAQMRLWPGLFDLDAGGTVSVPGDVSLDTSANARFWWDRKQFPEIDFPTCFDVINHPWWWQLDIKPKQKLGVLEVPVLSFRNSSSQPMNVAWWWRLLVSTKRR